MLRLRDVPYLLSENSNIGLRLRIRSLQCKNILMQCVVGYFKLRASCTKLVWCYWWFVHNLRNR